MKRNTRLLLMLIVVITLEIMVVGCKNEVSYHYDSSDISADVTVSGLWGKKGKFISVSVFSNGQTSGIPLLTTKSPLPEISSETIIVHLTHNISGFTENGNFGVSISLHDTADSTSTQDFKRFSDVLFESAKATVIYETNYGVTLDIETLSLAVGETVFLTATVSPANAVDKTVTWESSDTSIVTVENGTVTAKSVGTATITVTTTDGNYTAECSVTVNPPIAVTDVTLNENILTLIVGETSTLTATVSPDNATNKTVTWESSDTSIVTVENGTVTAKAVGTAIITVITTDGNYTAECAVTVNYPIVVTDVTLNENILTLIVGETSTLTVTVSPDNATNKTVTWESSDTSIVTVENGTVTAKAVGTATITVTTTDGNYTAECAVTVNPIAVTGVTLTGGKLYSGILSLAINETTTIYANVAPQNATNKTVTWESSDSNIATVENGTITAKAVGAAIITVTTTDSEKTAACTVYVLEPADFYGTWIATNETFDDEVWTVTIVIESDKIAIAYMSNTTSTSYTFMIENLTWSVGEGSLLWKGGEGWYPNTDYPCFLSARGTVTASNNTDWWIIGDSEEESFFFSSDKQRLQSWNAYETFIRQP